MKEPGLWSLDAPGTKLLWLFVPLLSKMTRVFCLSVCISRVYSPLFQALSLRPLYSTSMACTVSSRSSRFRGLTSWVRTAVVPGAKWYRAALEERRASASVCSLSACSLAVLQAGRPAVLPSPGPTSARALWVSSVSAAAWHLLQ